MGCLIDSVDQQWRGILDLSLDSSKNQIRAVNFNSGALQLWRTDLKTPNFDESAEKENRMESNNRKTKGNAGIIEKKKLYVGKSMEFKGKIAMRNRSLTPKPGNKEKNVLATPKSLNKQESLRSTLETQRKMKDFEENKKREKGTFQPKIEEVAPECESSILNIHRFDVSELKLSSFIIDTESSKKCHQFDVITEVFNYFHSF